MGISHARNQHQRGGQDPQGINLSNLILAKFKRCLIVSIWYQSLLKLLRTKQALLEQK